jgi:hypothetical protein
VPRSTIAAITAALSLACGGPPAAGPEAPAPATRGLADDPASATYGLGGERVTLVAGAAERPTAPGSAARARTRLLGRPVRGDLDGDGDLDAVVRLLQDPGGSGTFTWVAAALREGEGFRGTEAVLLGDRVATRSLRVISGIVAVEVGERRAGEPMAAPPPVRRTRLLTLADGALAAREALPAGDFLVAGWLAIGHEVRAFTPCEDARELWILGSSPALPEIAAAFDDAQRGSPAAAPIFALLAGHEAEAPGDGFGADYSGAFAASRLVATHPGRGCHAAHLVVEAPAPGARVASPLRVRGRARGPWYFEGDFPLELSDARGRVLARGVASARGEWMTEDFTPFEGVLEFAPPPGAVGGLLVLRKDNPSDLRELDAAATIPVSFR